MLRHQWLARLVVLDPVPLVKFDIQTLECADFVAHTFQNPARCIRHLDVA
jgi:hypothetical protein